MPEHSPAHKETRMANGILGEPPAAIPLSWHVGLSLFNLRNHVRSLEARRRDELDRRLSSIDARLIVLEQYWRVDG